MQWTVLIEHDPKDPGNYGAVVPWLEVATAGYSHDHVLEMAREVIAIKLEDMVAHNQPICAYEYLPTLAVVEVDIPTPEAALRTLQAETAVMEANKPISIAAAAARFGLTVFAVRRAIRMKHLYSRRIGHLRVVYPSGVENLLAERAERAGRSERSADTPTVA